jgi:hypothetical protein
MADTPNENSKEVVATPVIITEPTNTPISTPTNVTKEVVAPHGIMHPEDVVLPTVLITRADVSASTVDTLFYAKREMLLYEDYKTVEDTAHVIEFFHTAYAFRTAFSLGGKSRSSFAVYPEGTLLMSKTPEDDLTHKQSVSNVKFIYSVLFNITPAEWKVLQSSDEYKAFADAKALAEPVLGWVIPEYKLAEVPDTLEKVATLTYDQAAAMWDKATDL